MKIMDDKSIRSALVTTPQPATGWDEAAGYAERLAVVLWEKHFKSDAPQWKPLSGDLIGLLTQIDNMTTSLRHEAPAPAEGVTSAELIAALRAFPHFEDDTPVTPDAIRAVAKEYINMVMTWEPQRAALEFLDHAGNQHWLVYEAGDGDLAGGWTLRDDSNLAARPETAEARLREALNEVVTNGEWTEGEQRGEWKISKDVYDLAIEARDKALSPPSGGDEAKESDLGCMADFSPGDPANLKELLASEPSPPADRREIVAAWLIAIGEDELHPERHLEWAKTRIKAKGTYVYGALENADAILAALAQSEEKKL